MKKRSLLFAIALCGIACDNDLPVNVPEYREVMVVYGLLDPLDTAQYIQINKSFLGEANAYEMAKERDSIETHKDLDVFLQRMLNDQVVETIVLQPDSGILKDTGIFSFPYQVLFKTNTAPLTDGSEYRLIVKNHRTGDEATATTTVMPPPSYSLPPLWDALKLATTNSQPLRIQWSTVPNGRIYQLVVRFHYREYLTFDSTQVKLKHADWKSTVMRSVTRSGGTNMQVSLYQDNFFQVIASQIEEKDDVYRRFHSLEFIMLIGADELATYMDVLRSQALVFQEVPTYTNVEGGLGLFSSRIRHYTPGLKLSPLTLDTLREGMHTGHLGFQ